LEVGRKRDERPTSNIERPTSNEKQKKQTPLRLNRSKIGFNWAPRCGISASLQPSTLPADLRQAEFAGVKRERRNYWL